MKKRDSSKRNGAEPGYISALKRAAALCSRQEQSTGHIRAKLEEWGVSDGDTEKIIQQLKEDKFLDDERFATYYVKDKFRLNDWGRIKIIYMLRQKGIDENIILSALDQIDDDAYLETCVNLIRTKSSSLKEKNYFIKKGKLFRFASGRGFESDIIHRALAIIGKE
jgi:regulatory protein